jgi:transcriptional regulator with XRE-family HTH domain
MSTSGSPTVRRRRLAAELRRLREQSGQTAEAVGSILGWSKAKVSRYELAQSGLKPSDVESLLVVYRVQGERREQLLALAEEATQKGWWEAYADVLTEEHMAFIGLEAEATSVLQWQINVIPGLLQTEEYARDIFLGYQVVNRSAPAIIERRVQTRMIRQQVLARDKPLDLTVILDESVLRRQRGDRAMMHAQLQHLAEAAIRPNVKLRILPLTGPKRLALDSFQILRFGQAHETPLHDVVSAESLINYLYVEGETGTFEFVLAFEHLAQESLEPEESRELVLRIAEQLWALPAALKRIRCPIAEGNGTAKREMGRKWMNDSRPEEGRMEDGEGCHLRGGYWRKSSFSMSNGDCVEVAVLADASVAVRDSKATALPHLRFRSSAWGAFLGQIKGT